MWSPGETIVLRDIWRERIWAVWPAVVVEDIGEQIDLFIPAGTRILDPVDDDGHLLRLPVKPWRLAENSLPGDVLSFSWPDRAYAILGFWSADGELARWYVNLEDPLGRGPFTYDLTDHFLDVVVSPDRTEWRWKDEDELAEAVELGLVSAEEAARYREDGLRAIEHITSGEPPFDQEWRDWKPDPSWPIPTLVPGWDQL